MRGALSKAYRGWFNMGFVGRACQGPPEVLLLGSLSAQFTDRCSCILAIVENL